MPKKPRPNQDPPVEEPEPPVTEPEPPVVEEPPTSGSLTETPVIGAVIDAEGPTGLGRWVGLADGQGRPQWKQIA